MNAKLFASCLLGTALLGLAPSALAQTAVPSLMNYQGQLVDANGAPLTASSTDLSFSIFTVASGGTAVWGPQTFTAITLLGGQFNVALGPADSSSRKLSDVLATTSSAYLEIKVGNNAPLAPRQLILSAPYAFRAGRAVLADNATTLNGQQDTAFLKANAKAADSAKLNGLTDNDFLKVGGTAVNALKLNGVDWSAIFDNGNPLTGTFHVPGPISWGLSTLSPDQGGAIELGNFTPGKTSYIDFRSFEDPANDFNVRLMNDADRRLSLYGDFFISGKAGVGTSSPRAGLEIGGGPPWSSFNYGLNLLLSGGRNNALGILDSQGNNPWAIANRSGMLAFSLMPPLNNTGSQPVDELTIDGNGNVSLSNGGRLYFGANVRQMINLWSEAYGIGVQNNTLYQRSDAYFSWYQGGTHHPDAFNPGNGGRQLMQLDGAYLTVNGAGNEKAYIGGDGAGGDVHFGSQNPSVQSCVLWNPNSGLMDLTGRIAHFSEGIQMPGAFDPRTYYDVGGNPFPSPYIGEAGNYISFGHPGSSEDYIAYRDNTFYFVDTPGGGDTSNPVVKARQFSSAGLDLAEQFQTKEVYPKGSVVVLDPDHPGRLLLSRSEYDPLVAGVVSGAGGLEPGFVLSSDMLSDNGQPIALVGRVYALADAAKSPIVPGDLLTTSDTPGHLMKASDPARAVGTIIGKSMSALKEGQGLILILVSLR